MHVSPPKYALPVCFLAVLAACGGGGGGGGGPVDVQFTAFSAIAPNQRANMNGISLTGTGTVTTVVGGFLVDTVAFGAVDTANSRAQITFDANRNISAFNFTAPQSSAGFSSGIVCSSGGLVLAACVSDSATSVGVLGNHSHPLHNWNYQTYGVWLSQTSQTTFQAGAISVGAATAASAIPMMGTANFTGFTSGFYTENREPFFFSANVNANVDWANRNMVFSTNATTLAHLNNNSISNPTDLNLTGTLSFPSGNQITGTLTAARNSLSGTATGRFYGPTAEEMGGVYSLTNTTGVSSSLIGAFGARRP